MLYYNRWKGNRLEASWTDSFHDFDQDKFNRMIIQEEEIYYLQEINQEGKDDLP